MSRFTELEDRVSRMLLAGDDASLSTLRGQFTYAAVTSRQFTGTGFYTTISVPDELPRLRLGRSFKLADVRGTAANIADGIGFLLYVNQGEIAMLEGYTYGEPWPDEFDKLVIEYFPPGGHRRDMETVKRLVGES